MGLRSQDGFVYITEAVSVRTRVNFKCRACLKLHSINEITLWNCSSTEDGKLDKMSVQVTWKGKIAVN